VLNTTTPTAATTIAKTFTSFIEISFLNVRMGRARTPGRT
jgi:hypothetical protein